MTILGSGNVGIGSTAPVNTLDVGGTGIHLASGSPGATTYQLYNNAGTLTWNGMAIATGGSGGSIYGTANYIPIFSTTTTLGNSNLYQNASNNIAIGTTGFYTISGLTIPKLQVSNASDANVGHNTFNNTGAGFSSRIMLNRSRGATIGDFTIVQSGDTLGTIHFSGSDSSAFQTAAEIQGQVDATPSAGIVPGRLQFFTTNTSGTVTEAMRINSGGYVGIGSTNPSTALDVNGTVRATIFSGSGGSLTGLGVSNFTNITGTPSGTTYLRGDGTWGTPAGGGTVTSSNAGLVAYYQGTGTTVIGTSTIQISGGQVGIGTAIPTNALTVNGNVDAMGTGNGYLTEIPNSSTATVLYKLAKMYGSNTVTIGTTGDTDGMIGVVTGNAGTSGNAQIAVAGQAGCIFDGTPSTAGDFVTISSGTAGACHDTGSKSRTGIQSQIIGQLVNTVAIGTTTAYPVALQLNGTSGTTALANLTDVTLTSPANTNLLQYNGSKWVNTALSTVTSAVSAAVAPSFSVNKGGTSQGVATSTTTKLTFNTIAYDTNNNWSAANNRYVPTVAGKYIVALAVMCDGLAGGSLACAASIYKNGALVNYTIERTSNYQISPIVTAIIDMNGTTDYLEAYGYSEAPTATIDGAGAYTYFTGSLLAPLASGSVAGTGTANYIPIWTGSSALSSSAIYQTGGNVGIGTTSPIRALTVNGGEMAVIAQTSGTPNNAFLDVSDASGSNGGNMTFQIRGLGSNGTAQVNLGTLDIDANTTYIGGNVGIGNTSPYSTLQVGSVGDSSLIGTLGLGSITGQSNLLFASEPNGTGGGSQSVGGIFAEADSGWVSKLHFKLNSNWGLPTVEPLTVTSTAGVSAVGIGTTSPLSGFTLDVNGAIGSIIPGSGGIYLSNGSGYGIIAAINAANTANQSLVMQPNGGNVGIGTTSPGDKLQVYGGGAYIGDASSKLWVGPSGGTNYIESGNTAWNAVAPLTITGYYTNPISLLTLQATNSYFTGNVGIGTTGPGQILDVENSGTSNGIKVGNSGGNYLQLFDDGNAHIEGNGSGNFWINGNVNQVLDLNHGGGNTVLNDNGGYVQIGGYSSGSVPNVYLSGYRPSTWSANALLFGDELNNSRYFMNTRGTNENNNADWRFYYYNTGSGSNSWQTILDVLPTSLNAQTYAEELHDGALTLNSNGSATFTGTVSGVTPTASAHLATKAYVDTAVAGAGGSGAPVNFQVFTSSGTWTAPGSGSMALVQCWGGGGGGGGGGTYQCIFGCSWTASNGGGGGGGGYAYAWYPLSSLSSSVAVTIGGGGSAGGGDAGGGGTGGSTTFGSYLTATGGTGGANGVGGSGSGTNVAFTSGNDSPGTGGGNAGSGLMSGGGGGELSQAGHRPGGGGGGGTGTGAGTVGGAGECAVTVY